MSNKPSRLRRARKARAIIKRLGIPRLTVFRTPQHIYAQVIDSSGSVLATASTVERAFRTDSSIKNKIELAKAVGRLIADRSKAANIFCIAFDRSGFKYHGRIKALADAAREAGLEF